MTHREGRKSGEKGRKGIEEEKYRLWANEVHSEAAKAYAFIACRVAATLSPKRD